MPDPGMATIATSFAAFYDPRTHPPLRWLTNVTELADLYPAGLPTFDLQPARNLEYAPAHGVRVACTSHLALLIFGRTTGLASDVLIDGDTTSEDEDGHPIPKAGSGRPGLNRPLGVRHQGKLRDWHDEATSAPPADGCWSNGAAPTRRCLRVPAPSFGWFEDVGPWFT